MNDLDERLRSLVRTIGEAAPDSPPLRTVPEPARRNVVRGPLVAVASFVVILGLFAGPGLIFGGSDDPPAPDGSPSSAVTVRHQVIDLTLSADLTCGEAVGAGITVLRLEVWADVQGARFRERVTYPDGSTREKVALGDPDFPVRIYSEGESPLVSPACGEDLLGGDPTAGPTITFFNSAIGSTNRVGYEERGTVVAGQHTDSQGRPAVLYREVIDGFESIDDGTEYPIHQVTEWFVDEATGDVLETISTQQADGRYHLRKSFVVVSAEESIVDASIFDTTGFHLEWDGDDGTRVDAQPVPPSITLGTDQIWPQPRNPSGPEAVAERFAREILGWETPIITPDPQAAENEPTWVTIADDAGHQLTMLMAPHGTDGWGAIQIGEPTRIGVAPLGYASINPAAVPGAALVVIHVSTADGDTLAWQADLSDSPGIVVLPGTQVGDVMTLLVYYQDEAGRILAVNGGQFGP